MNQKQYSIQDFGAGSMAPWDATVYSGFFQSMRPCPRCRHKMNTNGNGVFRCPSCKHEDRKDVEKLKLAGLDYAYHPPRREKRFAI